MMHAQQTLLIVVVLCLLVVASQALPWGNKDKNGKKKKEKKMPKGKEAADLGLETLGQAAADPELMKMLFEDMNNPEMLAEAEKLMKDKGFKKKMDEMMNDPAFKATMQQGEQYARMMQQGGSAGGGLLSPSAMAEAMAMLENDPRILDEVEKLMGDKDFQAEMASMMDTPAFKDAMRQAEAMMQDPAQMAELQRQMGQMGGAPGGARRRA